jgi:hypothetical protein
MSALLEYECRVPVDGYEVITIKEPWREVDDIGTTFSGIETWRILQPRSERTRRFDLFKDNPSAFLEFAQTRYSLPDSLDGIKDFADRYGPLEPDIGTELKQYARDITTWSMYIDELRRTVELWKKSMVTGDFTKVIRTVQKKWHPGDFLPGVPVELLLKEDPLSGSARLCIRPRSLINALWAQFLLAIDGNVNLGACVQCRKWFTLEPGRGRSDKEYCSNACRMRAYRKRKVSG